MAGAVAGIAIRIADIKIALRIGVPPMHFAEMSRRLVPLQVRCNAASLTDEENRPRSQNVDANAPTRIGVLYPGQPSIEPTDSRLDHSCSETLEFHRSVGINQAQTCIVARDTGRVPLITMRFREITRRKSSKIVAIAAGQNRRELTGFMRVSRERRVSAGVDEIGERARCRLHVQRREPNS